MPAITAIPPIALLYLVASVVSLLVYGLDKLAAMRGARRVPEVVLHLLGLAGGWPGGLLAQRLFRHKCSKKRFQLVFWTVACCNAALGSSLYF